MEIMVKQRHIEVVSCMRIMRHYAERVRIAHGHMDAIMYGRKY